MKRLIYLFLILTCLFISGCDEPDTPTPDDEKYYAVSFDTGINYIIETKNVKEGSLLEEPTDVLIKEGYLFKGWTTINNDYTSLYDFSTPVTSDFTLYAYYEKDHFDYSVYLDEYVPSIIGEDLEWPTQIGDAHLIWDTSDYTLLSTTGKVYPARTKKEVTVMLEVYNNGDRYYYSKDVTIKALELKELESGNLTVGYYSSWNFFGYTDETLETLDIVNLCFAYVDSNNGLILRELYAVMNQVLEAHKKGVRVLLSVQGYGSDGTNFSLAAKTKESREKLAQNMLEVCEKYHFDGIDIDWEYPGFNTGTSTAIDRANYTLLMQEIYETLKAKDPTYLLTAAIPGGPYLTSRFDLANVHKYLDFINIMTYDLQSSGRATHHTALYPSSATISGCSVDESVKSYLNQGVPAEKIVIGIAFYGKYTVSSSLGGSGSSYKSITYTKILSDYFNNPNASYYNGFDETANAPYILDYTNGYFITYDNELSVERKCQYVLNNKLGGVMVWEIGEDMSGNLVSVINKTMKMEK